MSFFGKLRSLNNGPPAPPRRTGNTGLEWPQDEFDDEEADMYEAPPCERSTVPQRSVQENVYLERSSTPAVPQRQAANPPQQQRKFSKPQQDEFLDKPPEVDRNEKPGRKMMPPPPAARPAARPPHAHAPLPTSEDDDVYLDPNGEQEVNDDLYLEPEEAKKLPSPKAGPPPLKLKPKPQVPGANTQSAFPPMNKAKSIEDTRGSFRVKVAPPPPGVRPSLPSSLKDSKPMPSVPQMGDTNSVGGLRTSRPSGYEDKEWFAGDCSRKDAEDLLMRIKKDGAFLIRQSSNQSSNQPYTLAMLYQQKVYNIPIRFLKETQSYALGKEGKKNEEVFSSLDDMISFHRNNQILLIDSRSQAKHTANLTQAVHP